MIEVSRPVTKVSKVLAAISEILAVAVLFAVLQPNITYFIRGITKDLEEGEEKPRQRPRVLWGAFWITGLLRLLAIGKSAAIKPFLAFF